MRQTRGLLRLTSALALAMVGCADSARAPRPDPEPTATARPVPVDHHVHILGPQLIRDWKSLGVTFSRPDSAYLSADELLEVRTIGARATAPSVERAVLVPMAHLYGNSEFRGAVRLSLEEERARAAAENDHVAREAARWGERAAALCSVSALRPYAMEELERCRRELASAGIKLHLASSEVDLREAAHRAAVERIFAWAEERRLPILLHLDPQRRGHDAADVERFAREVLGPHPELTVIVAHLGGSGGYGEWTRTVFRTLQDWLEELRAAGDAGPAVYFDLSAVVLEKESEGVPPTTPQELEALAGDLRRAGLERILVGSDFPVFDPNRTADLLGERVGLTVEERDALLGNVAPGLFDR